MVWDLFRVSRRHHENISGLLLHDSNVCCRSSVPAKHKHRGHCWPTSAFINIFISLKRTQSSVRKHCQNGGHDLGVNWCRILEAEARCDKANLSTLVELAIHHGTTCHSGTETGPAGTVPDDHYPRHTSQ